MSEELDWDTADPLEIFRLWLSEAETAEPNDANAAALATSTPHGVPSVRMVLVKRIDQRGFCFFTNAESKKGLELAANPVAALCFHWKSLRRQVRVEGRVSELENSEVDAYFHSRSRGSQLGAAVSRQSRPLANRESLVEQVQNFGKEHPGEVPRPEYWRGYCVGGDRIEFWKDGADRLHDRFLFESSAGGWTKTRLYP
ncbi:Pyridoxamine 5'-phosphate oxidase [Acidisarcina polymorpha]|uniref:Pyridoxamine 5'-phosphate oxidase n=1 Tax=Acidisarcina polymorpha TaxID=2211140 RepID=A0A2Z5G391_9BACT|nr:pyridoxamine 5'-phosphate oxidase [Acidisarcina polymorpha]AXC13137.1 Pyridoxamine 5'-phosphate oxidase [Acidisarcina polymorpha]